MAKIHGQEVLQRARKNSIHGEKASSAIRANYRATNIILGKGAFGIVMLFNSTKNNDPVAIKIVRKTRIEKCQMKIMKDEIAIMTRFDHPHVIKHIESYEDQRYMFIVMEALTNSHELYEIIKS